VSRSPDRRVGTLLALPLLLASACAPTSSPRPSIAATQVVAVASPGPTLLPTLLPTPRPTTTIDVACTRETGELPPALRGDPCPDAVTAVELAVAPVRLPIDRIVVQPGPFYCENVWPGVGPTRNCYGVLVIPGQYMHSWVSFERSDEIAAVMLGRDLPQNLQAPVAKPIAWNATLVKVEVPPHGWTMP
jgi:hypothetical protein